MALQNRSRKPDTASSNPTTWTPPELQASDFHQSIGSSFVEQFVLGHDPIDVLRELVQNEFDAGGETMFVSFGEDGLTIMGSGRPIDQRGWTRLSVIVGVGRVVGDTSAGITEVAPKENGIGSKNFGLRSLFLFGDRIHVRSNGKMAVMDLPTLGTRDVPDPESAGTKGVTIYVPFRGLDSGKLMAFTPEREAAAIEGMAAELFNALGKLSLAHKQGRGIRRLELVSTRTGQNLLWVQTAESHPCSVKGVEATRRVGKLERWSVTMPHQKQSSTFEEIEYGRYVDRPAALTAPPFPAYYDGPRKKLKVSVSLPVRRKRIQLQQPGYFHYPLKAPGALTGAVASVSAPFELNVDRSEVVANDWNEWLAGQAALLSADLLTTDWLGSFGADAYLAVAPTIPPKRTWFMDGIAAELSSRQCWATEKTGVFSSAADLVVPSHPHLRGFLGTIRDVRSDLSASSKILEMAAAAGAKPFTPNALVRLRCSTDPNGAGLASKHKVGEAQFHYPDYAGSMSGVALQVSFGKALDAVAANLSANNRTDLGQSLSTLAADSSLQGAADLVVVPSEIWDACPVPIALRLHPDLFGSRVIRGLAKPFDLNDWASDIAQRAIDGVAEDREIEALYRHLLTGGEGLNRRSISRIRRSPVLKAKGGGWHAPDDLALLPPELMRTLGDAVKAPATAVAKNSILMARLSIRRKLSSRDLVAFAELVASGAADPEVCDTLVVRHLKLFTPGELSRLSKVAFIRNRAGGLSHAAGLHADTELNRVILDDDAKVLGSVSAALAKAMKVQRLPPYATLLDSLRHWRASGTGPKQPAVFYSALVAIMTDERRPVSALKSEPILWADGAYHPPENILVGAAIPLCFDLVFPAIQGAELQKAYGSLGAQRAIAERHWLILFAGVGERAEAGWKPNLAERTALRQCYSRRGTLGLPEGTPNDAKVFLSFAGTLHSRQELANGLLLENDFPELAAAVLQSDAGIAFADISEGGVAFFAKSGLRRLSEVCGTPEVSTGGEQKRPSWYQPTHEAELVRMMHDPDFAIALRELRWAANRNVSLLNDRSLGDMQHRLAEVVKVQFYSVIEKTFTIGETSATVSSTHAVANEEIALIPPRNMFDYRLAVAAVLAELAGAERLDDIRTLASAILPLLAAQSVADIRSYLASRGLTPKWSRNQSEDQLFEEMRPTAQAEAVVNDLLGQLMTDVAGRTPSGGSTPEKTRTADPVVPPPPTINELPPLAAVHATVAAVAGTAVAQTGGQGGGYGSGGFTYRSPAEMERDRLLGLRGEELAYNAEIDRVRATGVTDPETLVVWISKSNPGADHDIRSVGADGRPVYIEVKSTTGDDGRFDWSAAEFSLALKYGEDYELWRVYGVGGTTPTIKKFRDPAAMIARSTLRLQLSGLRAAVEPRS
jgi:hypothetical protein